MKRGSKSMISKARDSLIVHARVQEREKLKINNGKRPYERSADPRPIQEKPCKTTEFMESQKPIVREDRTMNGNQNPKKQSGLSQTIKNTSNQETNQMQKIDHIRKNND